ncbi:hypothetical protein D3OALGA1CA_1599 [Olavius algarvensis associated proteobacterium Delta 3]|nr:hypothetical protein D3OALGB2SA_398 [Olavius algarvensis associated proteobacterium Delta 3]CAB5103626.1 hypothetical protein D3OALGA1CA_1599 [Olavius algarvensis associated proteobacterium Delta 3]
MGFLIGTGIYGEAEICRMRWPAINRLLCFNEVVSFKFAFFIGIYKKC